MLLPALSKAREKARTISCTNKQKQTITACIMYSVDFNNWIIHRMAGMSNTRGTWVDIFSQKGEQANGCSDLGLSYITRNTLICPNDKSAKDVLAAQGAERGTYGMLCVDTIGNWRDFLTQYATPTIAGTKEWDGGWWFLENIKQPSILPFIADSAYDYWNAGNMSDVSMYGFYPWWAYYPMAARHGRTVNMAMADGHAESLSLGGAPNSSLPFLLEVPTKIDSGMVAKFLQ